MKLSRRHLLQRQMVAGLALLVGPLRSAWAARTPTSAADRSPMPLRVNAPRPDAAELLAPSAIHIDGWLGQRIDVNAKGRLPAVDMVPLLAGFQHKPGSHPWIGEHVGKWLHAATLAWSYTGDAALRAKLDQVATDLIAAQEVDGYLGTYTPNQRLALYEGADWDVWSHKYCLLGLLTYYRYTGHAGALQASEKAAQLLIDTFPARRSILAAGTHEGMAATSVLEPIVLLFRITGKRRYLRFAHYIVHAWDEPHGPGILTALLLGRTVNHVSNGKAYEMLSNIVGLAELARATGEARYLKASLAAWQDIVDKRLYVTGSTSQHEHFQADHDLHDTQNLSMAETCVTTTWIQLNLALLQMTGQARFGDELERAFYNHLAAAQHPLGHDWCYYTALTGRKPYDKDITCCHSSGPRGMALAPQAAYLRMSVEGRDTVLVSSLESSSVSLMLGGQMVTLTQRSGFPYQGESVLTLRMPRPARFALKVRAPQWAQPLNLPGAQLRDGWAELPARLWHDGDEIALTFNLSARLMSGEYTQQGKAALSWGPFVLAYDRRPNPLLPAPRRLGLARGADTRLMRPVGAPAAPLVFESDIDVPLQAESPARVAKALFVPFADAGAQGSAYQVWLRAPGVPLQEGVRSPSVLSEGEETRSRQGNGQGSVLDDDWHTLTNTYDGQYADQDWFAVTLEKPATVSRFVFAHGRNYHDGGWFDTSAGKPQVQIQAAAGGPWLTVGELADYPATTATHAAALADANVLHSFELRLYQPVQLIAVRVIGKPSSGDTPRQSFVTCSMLQGFER